MAKRVGSHLAVYNLGGITLPDGAETGLFVDSSGGLLVSGSLSIGAIVPGTGATNLGKAEDAPHASGDVGVFGLHVANEAQTTLAADGDYIGSSSDTKGNTIVVGNVASGAADAGAPVKISGKYNATLPTAVDGNRMDAQTGTRGSLNVTLMGQDLANPINTMATNADGVATSATATRLQVVSLQSGYNSSTFDRWYSNWATSILASAARTATTNGADQTNYNGRGVALTINVTVEAATETLSLKVQGKDPISSNYFDIVDFGVVYNATTDAPTITRTFVMYPGVLAADFIGITGNGTSGKSGLLPRTWRPVVTHSASGSFTYSLASAVIL